MNVTCRIAEAPRGASKFTSGQHGHGKRSQAAATTSSGEPKDLPTFEDIVGFCKRARSAPKCCRMSDNKYSCLEKLFVIHNYDNTEMVDVTKMSQSISTFRSITRTINQDELDSFLIGEVKQCITGRREIEGDSEYSYNWKLELNGGLEQVAGGPFHVCREAYAFVWGVTISHIKRIISTLKRSDYGAVISSSANQLWVNARHVVLLTSV